MARGNRNGDRVHVISNEVGLVNPLIRVIASNQHDLAALQERGTVIHAARSEAARRGEGARSHIVNLGRSAGAEAPEFSAVDEQKDSMPKLWRARR